MTGGDQAWKNQRNFILMDEKWRATGVRKLKSATALLAARHRLSLSISRVCGKDLMNSASARTVPRWGANMIEVEKKSCIKCGKTRAKHAFRAAHWESFEPLCRFCDTKINLYTRKGLAKDSMPMKCLYCERDFMSPNTHTRVCTPCKGRKVRKECDL